MIARAQTAGVPTWLVCPYDHQDLRGDLTKGLVCPSCQRAFPPVDGVINFLAHDENFAGLTYDLPHHPVPPLNWKNRALAKVRALPGIYYRLPLTSDHFSFLLERLLYRTVRGDSAFLDVGCREGTNLLYARPGGLCVGVDIDLASVRYARRLSPHSATFLASGTRLPFADRVFGAVACCDVVEHVAEYEQLLNEIARVTKSGGVLVLSTPDGAVSPVPFKYHVKHFTPEELRCLLGANFGKIDVRSVVRNCDVRRHYWALVARVPHGALRARLVNVWTNLLYYMWSYHKRESARRPDVSDSTLMCVALRK